MIRNVGEWDAFARGWAAALSFIGGLVAYFAIPPIEVARVTALSLFALSVPLAITAKVRFCPLYWATRRSTWRPIVA